MRFIWNQIKNFMSPLLISSMHGFLGGGVDCVFKGLQVQWFYDRMRITRRKVKSLLGNNHELL